MTWTYGGSKLGDAFRALIADESKRDAICDVSFILSDDRCVPCIRANLAAASDVLFRMLYGPMRESTCDVIAFEPEGSAAVVACFLDFCMFGRFAIPWTDIPELTDLADKYDVQPLKTFCLRRMCEMVYDPAASTHYQLIDPTMCAIERVLMFFKFAHERVYNSLMRNCVCRLKAEFSLVARNHSLAHLPESTLRYLIDRLREGAGKRVNDPQDVLVVAISTWVLASEWDSREDALQTYRDLVLQHINLTKLTREKLEDLRRLTIISDRVLAQCVAYQHEKLRGSKRSLDRAIHTILLHPTTLTSRYLRNLCLAPVHGGLRALPTRREYYDLRIKNHERLGWSFPIIDGSHTAYEHARAVLYDMYYMLFFHTCHRVEEIRAVCPEYDSAVHARMIQRVCTVVTRIATCSFHLGLYDEGIERCDEAIAIPHAGMVHVYAIKCKLLADMKRFGDAHDALVKASTSEGGGASASAVYRDAAEYLERAECGGVYEEPD